MRKRSVIILLVVLAIAVAALYGWNEFNRTNDSLVNKEEDYAVNAETLLNEFETSDSAAEKKYLGKLLLVNGSIGKIEIDDRNDYTIVLGKPGSLSGIRCAIDTTFRDEAAELRQGEVITIKGIVTGFQKDETGLLGSDVILNRAVLAQRK
jgi:hypothetical protein